MTTNQTTTKGRLKFATIKRCAEINPTRPVVEDVNGVRVRCVYKPPMAYGRVDKRAVRDAIPELLYVWTAQVGDEQPTVLNDPEDVIALLDGDSLESVKARIAEMVGDPFATIQKNRDGL